MGRIDLAAEFIKQSPPGQVNDVFSGETHFTPLTSTQLIPSIPDIRTILSDDDALESGIAPSLEAYNLEQFIVADLPGASSQVLICDAARVSSSASPRFIDPRSKQVFSFDHMQMKASDVGPLPVSEELEAIRKPLEDAVTAYVANHYSQGVSAVFALDGPQPSSSESTTDEIQEQAENPVQATSQPVIDEITQQTEKENHEQEAEDALETEEPVIDEDQPAADTLEQNTLAQKELISEETLPQAEPDRPRQKNFGIYFVGNRYNTANFWTGRWRSFYEYDCESGTLTGKILINVHYYEQGNVQLNTSLPVNITITKNSSDPSNLAKELVKQIALIEKDHQNAINQAYLDLSEQTFKSLRRALPITKQKLNWDRITSYKIKSELKKSEHS